MQPKQLANRLCSKKRALAIIVVQSLFWKNKCWNFNHIFFLLDFDLFPDPVVIIPPGGTKTVFCQYSDNPTHDSASSPLLPNPRVDWFRDGNTLNGPQLAVCQCIAVESTPLNLTFVNFQDPDHQGVYRCGAQYSFLDFDYCDFQVLLAGKGVAGILRAADDMGTMYAHAVTL